MYLDKAHLRSIVLIVKERGVNLYGNISDEITQFKTHLLSMVLQMSAHTAMFSL